jgi:hypothetical protein
MTTTPAREGGPSREAKRLAAMLLDVLAGVRTPAQAAAALGISLPRYYQLEDRGLTGLLVACETRPRGRRVDEKAKMNVLTRENERLKKELGRYQSLVRLTQRTVGVAPPTPAKSGVKRKRKPAVRAMRRADELRAEAEEARDARTEAAETV